jgi:hypothetical protein
MATTLLGTLAIFVMLYALAGVTQPRTNTAYAVSAHGMSMSARQDDVAPAHAQANDGGSDTRVWVQAYTIMAAGGAMAVGLLLCLVRVMLGRSRPPAPQDGDAAGHH